MELLAEDNIANFNNALIQVPFSGGKGVSRRQEDRLSRALR